MFYLFDVKRVFLTNILLVRTSLCIFKNLELPIYCRKYITIVKQFIVFHGISSLNQNDFEADISRCKKKNISRLPTFKFSFE